MEYTVSKLFGFVVFLYPKYRRRLPEKTGRYLELKYRDWTCPDCKTEHGRDINSLVNIKKNLIGIKSPSGMRGRACGFVFVRTNYES